MAALKHRCVILCASPEINIEFIQKNILYDDFIICADGGYDVLQKLKIVPDLIIGDFDSVKTKKDFSKSEVITLNVNKDDTDTMHCAAEAIKRGYKEILFLCATGGRIDHTLANLSVLYSLSKKGKAAYMIDKSSTTRVISVGKTVIEGKTGYGFGIFPFACEEAYLSLSGFEYELDNGKLTADHPVGVSNKIIKDKAEISVFSGTAVIVYYNLNP